MSDTPTESRVNKIKEATLNTQEAEKSLFQKKYISNDDIKLSSFSDNEEDDFVKITLKYNDCFLTTKIKNSVFKEYKLLNRTNIIDIISKKNLSVKGILFYNTKFFVEKYTENNVYKMEISSSLSHSSMNVSFNELLTITFTEITDTLLIINERLKYLDNNKGDSYSIYDFFIA